jgi:hypothetical protein
VARELGPNNTLTRVGDTEGERAACIPCCHSGRSPRATRGPIQMAMAIDHDIPDQGV